MQANNSTKDMMMFQEQTREVLCKIERAAKGSLGSYKKSIPSILLVGDVGVGRSEFAKEYERILKSNHVYTIRGTNTFLDLAFPRDGEEINYRKFFRSPGIAASIQNRFYGVFAISFEEWKGHDLLDSPRFEELLRFIDNNKDNIFYVFEVTSGFEAKDELKSVLNNHINLAEACLKQPDIQMAAEYIQDCMESDGLVLDSSGEKELRELLNRRLNIGAPGFAGYNTLRQISKSILFELLTDESQKSGQMEVTDNMLRNIESRIITPGDISTRKQTMGFTM